MMTKLRQILRGEKGQSLTEWCLVALLALGVFLLFRESSLLTQAKNTYDNVGSYLSGTTKTAQNLSKYGTISNTELMQVANEERISLDQKTLENLAGAFIGKTKNEIRAMLIKDPNFNKYDAGKELNQGNLLFDYYIEKTGDGEDGAVQTRFGNTMVSTDNLLNWMQGNYTSFDTKNNALTMDNRLFYSNDVIDPSGVMNGTVHEEGTYAVSVRCTFNFDKSGKVESVQIWATRNKQKKGTNTWIRNETDGLMHLMVKN